MDEVKKNSTRDLRKVHAKMELKEELTRISKVCNYRLEVLKRLMDNTILLHN